MSENNENERKKPRLYKKDDEAKKPDDKDVLQKLKDVRKNLQDSLDETSPTEPIKAEKRKRGERRLYKAEEAPAETPVVKPKKVKPIQTKAVSKKRMALVQRRVKAKVDSMQGLSKKKKAIIILWIVVATVPLFFLSTIAVASLEFDFTSFGIIYDETKPGTITLTFPVRNPSILPAQLGIVQMDLYDENGNYIGRVYTDVPINIPSFQTVTLGFTLDLTEETGGEWFAGWFSDLNLALNIRGLSYNGITVPDIIPPINLDIGPMVTDMISGLIDLEELLGGLSLESLLGGEAASGISPKSASSEAIHLDPYTKAKKSTLFKRLAQTEDLLGGDVALGFEFYEDSKMFSAIIDVDIAVGDMVGDLLGDFQIGPLNITNLDVQLMVNTEDRYESAYDVKNDKNAHKKYTTPIAKLSNVRPIEVYFDDRTSKISLNLTIFKDDIGGVSTHPSGNPSIVNWNDEDSIEAFLEGTGGNGPAWQEYPAWFFLYNILSLGGLDCAVNINNIDLNIFGLQMNGIGLDMSVLPVFYLDDGILDPNNFFYKAIPNYGFAGILKNMKDAFTKAPGFAFAGIPKMSAAGELTPADDFLSDLMELITFPEFSLDDISESWGPGANLSLTMPIGFNNTMFDIYAGIKGLTVGIASELNGETRNFLQIDISSPDGEWVDILGIDTEVILNLAITIFKDDQHAPHAEVFLRSLLEDFYLDAIISVNFTNLRLMKEKYTFGAFEIAIPIAMDLGGLVEDLIGTLVPSIFDMLNVSELAGGSASAPMLNNPLAVGSIFNSVVPISPLLGLLQMAPSFVPYSSQLDDLGIEDMVNDLINSLINELLGDALGIEMSMGFGFSVVEAQKYVELVVDLYDLTVDTPITIGLGYTDMSIQGKDENGEWERMVALQIDNYFEIRKNTPVSFQISLVIYYSDALCSFINEFIENGTFSLKIAGDVSFNLSGISIGPTPSEPNELPLSIELAIEDIDTGINISELIEGLIGGLSDIDLFGSGESAENPPSVFEALGTMWWDGILDNIPFVAQGIDIESMFSLGTITIVDFGETGWPNVDQGNVTIVIGITVTNWLMGVNLKQFELNIFENASDPTGSALGKVEIVPGTGMLSHGAEKQIQLRITLYKSMRLQNFIQNIVNTFQLSGYIDGQVAVDIFGCSIGPIYIPPVNLSTIPLDITSLLGSILPFTAPFESFNPNAAQDIDMNSILDKVAKFAIGEIALTKVDMDTGPLNYTDPALALSVGLFLQPKFNMTIKSLNLNLLDKKLYSALLDAGIAIADVVEESKVVEVIAEPQPCYFNTSNGILTNQLDLEKPYMIAGPDFDNETRDVELIYDKNDPRMAGRTAVTNETFLNSTTYYPLNISGLREISLVLNVLNKSHGSWETRYDRKYWKALGGPYFPVQVYGPEYGGYPDHRVVYHDYFSPTAGILTGLMTALEDPTGILAGLAIGGSVEVNVFSMNISIDLNKPIINEMMDGLMGMLMDTTSHYIREGVKMAANPLAAFDKTTVNDRYKSRLQPSQDISDLIGDINFDLFAFLLGFGIGCLNKKNDHAYVPNHGHDGITVPYISEYMTDPINVPGYKGGLDQPFFQGTGGYGPKELFVKDDHYEWFKVVVQNWMDDMNMMPWRNPYFETHEIGDMGYMAGDPIEDSEDWPLRWMDNRRIRTFVLSMYFGLVPKVPLGLLSGRFSVWVENPIQACEYFPIGYATIGDSVNFPYEVDFLDDFLWAWNNPLDVVGPAFSGVDLFADWTPPATTELLANDSDSLQKMITAYLGGYCDTNTYPHPKLDNTGAPDPNGPNLGFHIRLFESAPTQEFFWQLISGGDFNIHFITQGSANISLLGYEMYGAAFPLDMGNAYDYAVRCEEFQEGAGGGSNPWGVPGEDGEVEDAVVEREYWPHEWLLTAGGGGFEFEFALDSILDFESFLDFGDLLGSIDILALLFEGASPLTLTIANPIPLPFWIEFLYLEIHMSIGSVYMELISVSTMQPVSLMTWPGMDPADPWDLDDNTFQDFTTPQDIDLHTTITLDFGELDIWALLFDFLLGGESLWIYVEKLYIGTIFPPEFDYSLELVFELDLEPMEFTLDDILGGL